MYSEQWNESLGHPHGSQDIDLYLMYHLVLRLPVKLSKYHYTCIVHQCSKFCKIKLLIMYLLSLLEQLLWLPKLLELTICCTLSLAAITLSFLVISSGMICIRLELRWLRRYAPSESGRRQPANTVSPNLSWQCTAREYPRPESHPEITTARWRSLVLGHTEALGFVHLADLGQFFTITSQYALISEVDKVGSGMSYPAISKGEGYGYWL